MTQVKQAAFRQYVLAGDSLQKRERISVSSQVLVDNPGEEDGRVHYVAREAKRPVRTISLKWAAIFMALCLLLCLFMSGSKIALTQSLQEEYALLSARYKAAQQEEQRLQEVFAQKSDASGICYYAVRNLGMRLAGFEETISVQATGLSPVLNDQLVRGSASSGQ